MNLKKARELRKKVYGDMSLKTAREYTTTPQGIRALGLRGQYQYEKRKRNEL
jgi:hypothetical protein